MAVAQLSEHLQPSVLVGLYLAIISCSIGLWFCILAWAFGDWKPNWRLISRRTGHIAIFALVMVITSQSQTGPTWAQQAAEDLRGLGRDVSRLNTEVRLASRDIGAIQQGLAQTSLELKEDLADHEIRLRGIERSIDRGTTLLAVLIFVAPAIFQALLWGIQAVIRRRNGNGHGHTAHGVKI